MIRLILPALLALPLSAAAQLVPTEFTHDRIFVRADMHGTPARFYTDTGGGWNAVSARLVAKAGLETGEVPGDGKPMRVVAFPALGMPPQVPAPSQWFLDGRLAVADEMEYDGFLGGRWFADRIWEIDYAQQTLRVLDRYASADDAACISLGFQTNAEGQRTMHFPSMEFSVDGETLPALLDTGATMTVAEKAAPVLGVAVGTEIATSFIERSVFERWQAAHPGWRVVESADAMRGTYFRAIEVPQIEIAAQRVGPVWFAERPEGTFQQYMASMMDRPVWGALGGSAFRHFRMVIDYPAARACFHANAAGT